MRTCHATSDGGSAIFQNWHGLSQQVRVYSDPNCQTQLDNTYFSFTNGGNWNSAGTDFFLKAMGTSPNTHYFPCGLDAGPPPMQYGLCWVDGVGTGGIQMNEHATVRPCLNYVWVHFDFLQDGQAQPDSAMSIQMPQRICMPELVYRLWTDSAGTQYNCYSGAFVSGVYNYWWFLYVSGNPDYYQILFSPQGCVANWQSSISIYLGDLMTLRDSGVASASYASTSSPQPSSIDIWSTGCHQAIASCFDCMSSAMETALRACSSDAQGAAKEVIQSYISDNSLAFGAFFLVFGGADPLTTALGAVDVAAADLQGQARVEAQSQCESCLASLITVIQEQTDCTDNCNEVEAAALSEIGGLLEDNIDASTECCRALWCPCTSLPTTESGGPPNDETCGAGVSEVSPNTNCELSCANGFQPSPAVIACQAGGTFERLTFTCSENPCTTLPTVQSGSGPSNDETCGPGIAAVAPGETCDLACAYGSEPSVTSTVCQAGGTFESSTYSCVQLPCTSLPTLQGGGGGSATDETCGPGVGEVPPGEQCQPVCADGYAPSPVNILCQVGGVFESVTYSCSEIACRDLPTVESGTGPVGGETCGVGVVEVQPGESCQLACADGSEPSVDVLLCRADGTFASSTYSCVSTLQDGNEDAGDDASSSEVQEDNEDLEDNEGVEENEAVEDGTSSSEMLDDMSSVDMQNENEDEGDDTSSSEMQDEHEDDGDDAVSSAMQDDNEDVGDDTSSSETQDENEDVGDDTSSSGGAREEELEEVGGYVVSGVLRLAIDSTIASDFAADPAVEDMLQHSIASTLSGVQPTAVEILSVTLGRRLDSTQRRLQSSSVIVDYQVVLSTAEEAQSAAEVLTTVSPSVLTDAVREEIQAAGLSYEVTVETVEASAQSSSPDVIGGAEEDMDSGVHPKFCLFATALSLGVLA